MSNNRIILLNGLKIALVVGTILNLINQGDIILAGAWSDIHWFKLMLTYCVPFGVSVYSAMQVKRSME